MVRAVNVATQAAAGLTNTEGNYAIPFLLPGIYTVTVEAQGFNRFQREGVQVRVSDLLELNIEMSVGMLAATVEVVAGTPLLETANVSLGQVIDQRRVLDLPIQAGNPFELMLLAPGVVNATDMRLRKPHTFSASLSQLLGNHSLRYGAEFRLYREFQNRFAYDVSPSMSFDTTYTRGPREDSTSSPRGQDMATFLLGIPTGGSMARSASWAEQEKFWAFHFQDDWKLSRKLTLNIGLRYEYESPLTERFDRSIKGFDFTSSNPIEAAARTNYAKNPLPELPVDQFRIRGGLLFAGGAAGRDLWEGEKNNLMPRIGIAYTVTPRMVLCAGGDSEAPLRNSLLARAAGTSAQHERLRRQASEPAHALGAIR